jgi:hypothetical protein
MCMHIDNFNCGFAINALTEVGWIAPQPHSNGGHERKVKGTESKDRILGGGGPSATKYVCEGYEEPPSAFYDVKYDAVPSVSNDAKDRCRRWEGNARNVLDGAKDSADLTVNGTIPALLFRLDPVSTDEEVIPGPPGGRNWSTTCRLATAVDVEDKPDPSAGVVHPAQIEDNGSMIIRYPLVASSSFG